MMESFGFCFLCLLSFSTQLHHWSSFIGYLQNRAVKSCWRSFLSFGIWNHSSSTTVSRLMIASGRLMIAPSWLMMAPSRLMFAPGRLMVAPSRLTSFHWSTDERLQSTDHFCWSTDEGLQSTDLFPLVDWWMAPVDWWTPPVGWSLSSGRLMTTSSRLITFLWSTDVYF